MGEVTFNARLRALLDRAGVRYGSRPAHQFRRTVSCELYEGGVREDVINRILGWAPASVRQRHYSRVADDAMQSAILVLYRGDPITASRAMA